jgi:hypothetical protein
MRGRLRRTTPSISPRPKRSPFFETPLGDAVAHERGGVAPAGLMPIQQPITQERNDVIQ